MRLPSLAYYAMHLQTKFVILCIILTCESIRLIHARVCYSRQKFGVIWIRCHGDLADQTNDWWFSIFLMSSLSGQSANIMRIVNIDNQCLLAQLHDERKNKIWSKSIVWWCWFTSLKSLNFQIVLATLNPFSLSHSRSFAHAFTMRML